MQAGPISRTRASQRKYNAYFKQKGESKSCEFCAFQPNVAPVLEDYDSFWVVENVYGYDIWDGCRVNEHLMIVPKRHVHSLGELTKKEKASYVEILSQYESSGYSTYSRAPTNITKSVAHQHTHLIKIESRRIKAQLYVRKPHLLLYK